MLKIFLVEDEVIVRKGIKENIDWAGEGFVFCGEAADGELAYPLIQREKPDILITDIRMPFMDGLELSRLVKQELPQCKIIILSGHEEFSYAQEALKIGVTEYILKPINSTTLLESIKKVADIIIQERLESENIGSLSKTDGVLPDLHKIGEIKLQQVETFLKSGASHDIPLFVEEFLKRIFTGDKTSALLTQYILMDIYFTTAKVLNEISGSLEIGGSHESNVSQEANDSHGFSGMQSPGDSRKFDSLQDSGKNLLRVPGNIGDAIKNRQKTKEFITNIFRAVIERRDELTNQRYRHIISQAKEYISERYSYEDISLKHIAKHVNVSPNHFSAMFARETGQGLIQYLTEYRIDKAKELLRSSNMRSSEVGAAVGYKDPQYFSYVFKKLHKCTPKQYRSMARQGGSLK
jgi:two-component system response regulator YesN